MQEEDLTQFRLRTHPLTNIKEILLHSNRISLTTLQQTISIHNCLNKPTITQINGHQEVAITNTHPCDLYLRSSFANRWSLIVRCLGFSFGKALIPKSTLHKVSTNIPFYAWYYFSNQCQKFPPTKSTRKSTRRCLWRYTPIGMSVPYCSSWPP